MFAQRPARLLCAVVLPLVVVLSAACGSSDSDSTSDTAAADTTATTVAGTAVDVTALEYEFGGVGPEYPKGPFTFDLTNDGSEVHEMVLLQVKARVFETAAEIVALPEAEAQSKVDVVNAIGPVQPGGSDQMTVDLENGRYILACFLPEGTTSLEALETAEGAPHASRGMFRVISVTHAG